MILAIDYGTKRIGLAIADESGAIPLPFKEMANKGRDLVLQEIEEIIKVEKINIVVVGLPINLAGIASQKTLETQKFIDSLSKKIFVPVIKIDERFTSRLSDTMSLGTEGSRDVGAAMIILEDYLQRQKI
ncbi:MAG: Holliday junction resolvase RuvX [Candidatus Magasanikbacteria bacterium]|nr:Holliday junction resolvase RuvX [Candidatus Magasanikbacteria bacterium]